MNSPDVSAYLGKKRDDEETVCTRGIVCSPVGNYKILSVNATTPGLEGGGA